jgi:hypothetical protein
MVVAMTRQPTRPAMSLLPKERDFIRHELDRFFSTYPSVADGFSLRTWRAGPNAGKAKVPGVAQGLIDRNLMRLDEGGRLPLLFFTEAGLEELRAMMQDRRFADPEKFAHVRQELGIDPPPEDDTVGRVARD